MLCILAPLSLNAVKGCPFCRIVCMVYCAVTKNRFGMCSEFKCLRFGKILVQDGIQVCVPPTFFTFSVCILFTNCEFSLFELVTKMF